MEEYKRQKKEERRRVKNENRERQRAIDNSNNSSEETVLTAFERRKVPPRENNKKYSLEVIREYGWVAKSRNRISVPSPQHQTWQFSESGVTTAYSPRRSVQSHPSPGSAISDLTCSQSSPSRPSPISKKVVKTFLNFQSINFDDDSDDDDILNLADFLAKDISTATPMTDVITSVNPKQSHIDSPNESQVESQVAWPINPEESEKYDSVKRCQKVESRHKRAYTSRNPLALHKNIKENITPLSKIKGRQDISQNLRNNGVAEDTLWVDSDQGTSSHSELMSLPGSPCNKEKEKSNQTNGLQMKSKANLTPSSRETKNRASLTSRQDRGRSEEVILEIECRPEFQNPKLGPPSAFVPLILVHSQGEHHVPASINRYLKDYQRAGIRFIHNRIAAGKGCILGDDMGMSQQYPQEKFLRQN